MNLTDCFYWLVYLYYIYFTSEAIQGEETLNQPDKEKVPDNDKTEDLDNPDVAEDFFGKYVSNSAIQMTRACSC